METTTTEFQHGTTRKGSLKKRTKSERINFRMLARVVQSELSGLRRATAKTKRRGEVRGGGKKPWKQKGTGRARVGSIRSPLWRGGGTVFGPDGTQNFYAKVNKKERAIALEQAMAFHVAHKTLTEIELPKVEKTKGAAVWLAKEGIVVRPLLVVGPKETVRSFRNLSRVSVAAPSELSPVTVLSARQILRVKEIKA